jgi:hypothetical protein
MRMAKDGNERMVKDGSEQTAKDGSEQMAEDGSGWGARHCWAGQSWQFQTWRPMREWSEGIDSLASCVRYSEFPNKL